MVEWKELQKEMKVLRGKRLTKNLLDDNASYPVFHGGIEPLGRFRDYNREANTVMVINVGASAGTVGFCDSKFWSSDGCFCISHSDKINSKFLYYFLFEKTHYLQSQVRYAGIPTLDNSVIEKIRIPILSLSEQTRIVGILDTFTASIENLKEQIAERRKQYEYYRDQLLDLEGKEGVEMKTLVDLFTFKNGLNKGKEYFGKGKPIIMFTNVFNSRSIDASMIKSRVNISDDELERIDAKVGDVFFTRTSETREDVGYASVLLQDVGDCTFAGFLIRARPTTKLLSPGYCKYCFSTTTIRKAIVNNSSFTTRASLTGGGLGNVILPIPSLSEQSRIVSILDTFEASITNLEAQLKEREKQYEYYRNKLLTFE